MGTKTALLRAVFFMHVKICSSRYLKLYANPIIFTLDSTLHCTIFQMYWVIMWGYKKFI